MFSDIGDGGDSCGNADGDFHVGSASASTMSPHQSESHVLSFNGFAVKHANCRCVGTVPHLRGSWMYGGRRSC